MQAALNRNDCPEVAVSVATVSVATLSPVHPTYLFRSAWSVGYWRAESASARCVGAQPLQQSTRQRVAVRPWTDSLGRCPRLWSNGRGQP